MITWQQLYHGGWLWLVYFDLPLSPLFRQEVVASSFKTGGGGGGGGGGAGAELREARIQRNHFLLVQLVHILKFGSRIE